MFTGSGATVLSFAGAKLHATNNFRCEDFP